MLLITKGEINEIAVTAAELAEANDVTEYRFVFRHEQQKKEYEITLTDESDYTNRYNLFTFTEGTDITLRRGEYKYWVYDLDDNLVEVGIALVINSEEAVNYSVPLTSLNHYINS